MACRTVVVVGVMTLAFGGAVPAAHAQPQAFGNAVRELATAAASGMPLPGDTLRGIAERMATALAGWNREVSALEARVARELTAATPAAAGQLHVELGQAYLSRGRIDDAVKEFNAALAAQRSVSDLERLRALTLDMAGRTGDAGAAFRAAWGADPRSPLNAYYLFRAAGASPADRDAARLLLENVYAQLSTTGPRAGATPFLTIRALPDGISRSPVIAGDATVAEAFDLLARAKFDDAVAAVRRERPATLSPEDSPLAHFARGRSAEAENRVADARREYQAALAGTLFGRHALLVGIARLAEVDGDLDAAIDAFAAAARLDPNNALIHKELASAYLANGRAAEAFAEMIAALLIDPRDGQAHAMVGQLYLDGGRDTDAATAFTRALDVDPDRYETRYVLAQALTRLGRSEDAARQLELFDRARREALERRRRGIAEQSDQEERAHRQLLGHGTAR